MLIILFSTSQKYLELSGYDQLGCGKTVIVVHGNKNYDGQNNRIVRYQGSDLNRKINQMSSRMKILYSGREEWRQLELFQEERQEESSGEEEEGEEEDIRSVVTVVSHVSSKPRKGGLGVGSVFLCFRKYLTPRSMICSAPPT